MALSDLKLPPKLSSSSLFESLQWKSYIDKLHNLIQDILDLLGTGSGSGVDADTLDGQHGTYYTNASNLASGTVPLARIGTDTPGTNEFLASDNTWSRINYNQLLGTSGVIDDVLRGDGTFGALQSCPIAAIEATGTPTTNNFLQGDGTWSAVNLSNDVTGSLAISSISATGTPSSTTYLRGDGTWSTVSSGGKLKSQEYTSSGGGTWTAPTGVTSCWVTLQGGGGGGASGSASGGGGGGGSGALLWRIPVTVVAGADYDVYVGANGNGGTFGGSAATDVTDSYFEKDISPTIRHTALGGKAGVAGSGGGGNGGGIAGFYGTGGSDAAGGDVVSMAPMYLGGAGGGDGSTSSSGYAGGDSMTYSGGTGGGTSGSFGGAGGGGASFFGAGGNGGAYNSGGGAPGSYAYGAGGGGGGESSQNGAAGRSGYALIEWIE